MRDIREDLLQRRIGIASRYFEAIARFEEQLQSLHESHRKLIAEISSEKGAVDAMLAIEYSRVVSEGRSEQKSEAKKLDPDVASTLLKNLSEIIQRYPIDKNAADQQSRGRTLEE
ncbi:MAG TPA: hypothetical protein VKV77_05190 [Methylovirgula sp.]|nr:hypothetical protein [Methylovirgula sp.]